MDAMKSEIGTAVREIEKSVALMETSTNVFHCFLVKVGGGGVGGFRVAGT